MIKDEFFTLNNGVTIPAIGFGTWQIPNDTAITATKYAIDCGYRHIDTASAYNNECGVGKGVKDSGVKREELFITTKVPAWMKTAREAKEIIEKSLANLDVDYIDLLLIHAPKPWDEMVKNTPKTYFSENIEVWKVMEEYYRAGKLRSIGVSNFNVADMENIKNNCTVPIAVNQIRYHIGCDQSEIIDYCKRNGIVVEAYSPIATGRLLNNATVAAMAQRYNVTIAQLCIKYTYQNGTLPLPKSTHEQYILSNLDCNFTIVPEDMEALNAIKE